MFKLDGSISRKLQWIALLLALAVALQGVIMAWLDRLRGPALVQCLLISLALAVAAHELWRNRRRLDHRIDMALVMMALGGLGMLAGTWIDMAQAGGAGHGHGQTVQPAKPLPPCCHAAPADASPASPPPSSGSSGFWGGFYRALTSWMTILMLLGGIPPSLVLSRCCRLARLSWRRWWATHIAGNLGMLTGMILAGMAFGPALGERLGAMVSGHHLAMLAGMLVGMELAQFLAEAALGLRPWRRLTGQEAEAASIPATQASPSSIRVSQ